MLVTKLACMRALVRCVTIMSILVLSILQAGQAAGTTDQARHDSPAPLPYMTLTLRAKYEPNILSYHPKLHLAWWMRTCIHDSSHNIYASAMRPTSAPRSDCSHSCDMTP